VSFRRNAVPSPSGPVILHGMLDIEDEDTMIPLSITNCLTSDKATHSERLENSLYLLITGQAMYVCMTEYSCWFI
jgi:hypothetical protein